MSCFGRCPRILPSLILICMVNVPLNKKISVFSRVSNVFNSHFAGSLGISCPFAQGLAGHQIPGGKLNHDFPERAISRGMPCFFIPLSVGCRHFPATGGFPGSGHYRDRFRLEQGEYLGGGHEILRLPGCRQAHTTGWRFPGCQY